MDLSSNLYSETTATQLGNRSSCATVVSTASHDQRASVVGD